MKKIKSLSEENNSLHRLSVSGDINPDWLLACLRLFKEQRVNIKSLVLRPDFYSADSRHMHFDLHFMPSAAFGEAQRADFLQCLLAHLENA
ncbi:MAG: hypothetical protein VKJ04_06810 [Vampirovibrionales bacterium]|nr:hypothetical protein [Vampirovibrionales bacterium]